MAAMIIPRLVAAFLLLGLCLRAFPQTEQKPPEQKPPEQKQPVVVKLPQKVAEKLKIHDETPVYPAEAKRKGLQGNVVMEIVIDTAGKISGAKVIEGNPVFVASAAQAMKQWRYKPYLVNGQPAQIETTVTVRFWSTTSRF